MKLDWLKEKLQEYAPVFVCLLLLIQPLMDVLSYWLNEFEISNTPTLLLRMAVMGISLLWGFILTPKKKTYWITVGMLLFVLAGHIFACLQVGYADPIGDISNYIRVVQTPLFVLVLCTCLKANEKTFKSLMVGCSCALLIILVVEVLSVVTKTNPGTYTDGTGILGWFFNTNSQSAVIAALVPAFLCLILTGRNTRFLLFSASVVVGCGALFFLGTRLAYASIFAITIGLGVGILIACRAKWKNAVILFLTAILFFSLYPLSPMVLHQNNYYETQQDRQENLDQIIENEGEQPSDSQQSPPEESLSATPTDPSIPSQSLSEHEQLVQRLKPIYVKYINEFVEIFGLEQTMEMYDYTSDPFDFSDLRKRKILVAEHIMDSSPVSTRIFGSELSRFTIHGNIYDVENDFHGILYLYGVVGLAFYLLFLAYFLYLIIYALIKNFKKYVTIEAISFGLSLLLCLVHAFFTAGVLRRPNASVYLAVTLSVIYYLVRVYRYDKT